MHWLVEETHECSTRRWFQYQVVKIYKNMDEGATIYHNMLGEGITYQEASTYVTYK
jgi:hypothetical protein